MLSSAYFHLTWLLIAVLARAAEEPRVHPAPDGQFEVRVAWQDTTLTTGEIERAVGVELRAAADDRVLLAYEEAGDYRDLRLEQAGRALWRRDSRFVAVNYLSRPYGGFRLFTIRDGKPERIEISAVVSAQKRRSFGEVGDCRRGAATARRWDNAGRLHVTGGFACDQGRTEFEYVLEFDPQGNPKLYDWKGELY